MRTIEQNQAADQKINSAVEAFQSAASGGVNLGAMVMNPGGAMKTFGGPMMQLVEGLQEKNRVVTELIYEVESLKQELEVMNNG